MDTTKWYYGQGDKEMGPVSSEELRELAVSGKLGPHDMIWKEGMPNWVEASSIQGLIPTAAAPKAPEIAGPSGSVSQMRGLGVSSHPLDYLLNAFRSLISARVIEKTVSVLATAGGFCLLAYVGLYLLFSLCIGAKKEAIEAVVGGGITAIILVAIQYAAWRFTRALESLIKTTPTQLNSTAVPDTLGLLFFAGGIMTFVMGIFDPIGMTVLMNYVGILFSIDNETIKWGITIAGGIGFTCILMLMAMICIQPTGMNISICKEEMSAGQEAIGVIAFLMKASARVVVASFGLGVMIATGALLLAFVPLFQDNGIREAEMAAESSLWVAKRCGLMPLYIYLLLLVWFVAGDVVKAIISLPGKLDRLAGDQ